MSNSTLPAESIDIEANQKRQEAPDKAKSCWDEGQPATEHPYTTKKGLEPEGLRVKDTLLLIPMYGADGQVLSVQRIWPDGKKRFLKGCPTSELFCPIGGLPDNAVVVVEGWATGMSVHQATGLVVVVAFSSDNMGKVVALMRNLLPNIEIVIAPDNDKNRHAIEVAESASRQHKCQVVVPQFPEGVEGTDFDDLRQSEGPEEVKRQVMTCQYRPVFEAVVKTEQAIDWPDYPVEALGPVLSEAALAIANVVQVPAHIAGQSVLAAAALAAQGLANVQIDNRVSPLSLFCLTVGAL